MVRDADAVRDAVRRYLLVRSELNAVLDEWDPLGVYDCGDGPGPGEYDRLAEVAPIALGAGGPLRHAIDVELATSWGLSDLEIPEWLLSRIETLGRESGLADT